VEIKVGSKVRYTDTFDSFTCVGRVIRIGKVLADNARYWKGVKTDVPFNTFVRIRWSNNNIHTYNMATLTNEGITLEINVGDTIRKTYGNGTIVCGKVVKVYPHADIDGEQFIRVNYAFPDDSTPNSTLTSVDSSVEVVSNHE
jgi:hypothetical protein